ncbi:hypothetical protein [Tenacibaculum sp.]|uniref:hypothetical protein n=1 Tax=Tenacibaculum sp. TaxID=1906242 RepID=UPI003D09ED96
MSNSIKLNFVNKSNDVNNSSIVIFQKNVADSFDDTATAWKVIRNPGYMDSHPINYSTDFQVAASDSYGNHTPTLTSNYGDAFEMTNSSSGNILQKSSNPTVNPDEVEVRNNLITGAIDANCYKDGKLLATKRGIAPAQKAIFKFTPSIYIGVVSQIVEGDIINSAIISQINTEISLFGINSADIVMTGGGPNASSEPFSFNLENVR